MDARSRTIRALLPFGLVAASLFATGPAAAAPSSCGGHTPTIVGTTGNDVIVGTNGVDVIDGLGGDDVIYGLAGADVICGNNGRDVIHGGDGDDRLFGGSAIDVLYGDGGRDELRGNTGRDTLYGGPHDDVLYGGVHADELYGDGGADTLLGGHDGDYMSGGTGDDVLVGGTGDDVLHGDNGSDRLDGTVGADVADGGAHHDRCEAAQVVACEDDLNDAPAAMDDTFVANENQVLVGNLFEDNGAGPDADPNADPIRVATVDGAPVVGSVEIALSSGAVVTVGDDGTFSYEAGSSHDGLGEGNTLEDGFQYTVADPKGKTDDAAVAVLVAGANDAPIAGDDEDGTDEDTAVDVAVLLNDIDPEEHDLAVVSVDATGISGSISINPDNTIRYVPAAAFGHLSTGEEVEEQFTYVVADGFGGTAMATVTVYVEGVNDAPDAQDDTAVTEEDAAVTMDVLANDADPEGSALTIMGYSDPAHGTVAQNGPSTFEYTPDADWNGVDSFTYTVEDATGNASVATATVTVAPVNDAPDAVDDAASATPGEMVVILVLANDTDVDGDELEVTIDTDPSHGNVVVLSNGALAYTADEGYVGNDTLTYRVSDAAGSIDTATVSVTVSN